jgi:1-deoxy-D-xylulose-5-phosphate synthase
MLGSPAAVRYPRGSGPGVAIQRTMTALPVGRAQVRRTGRRIALLAFGSMVTPALAAGTQIDATVVNMRFVKPLDNELVAELARSHELLVTVEENALAGGAGSAVNECLAAAGLTPRVLNLGLPDRFTSQGSRGELLAEYGLDTPGILHALAVFNPH